MLCFTFQYNTERSEPVPDLFKSFAEEFMAEINRVRMEETADIDAARSELNRIDSQIDKLVMAIADGEDALP